VIQTTETQRRFSLEEPGSFSTLYEAHAEELLAFLARRCFDVEVAVDLTAETFAQALAGRRRFRGATESEAVAWLFGIARRQLGKYFRRGQTERKALGRLGISVPPLSDEDYARVEELAGLSDVRHIIGEHFAALPVDQQQALQLRVVEERPYPEIANRLSVSEQVVRARVSRGLKRLALAMEAPAAQR
jgi:RNA polymerase sigma factor (sigma-70 family)